MTFTRRLFLALCVGVLSVLVVGESNALGISSVHLEVRIKSEEQDSTDPSTYQTDSQLPDLINNNFLSVDSETIEGDPRVIRSRVVILSTQTMNWLTDETVDKPVINDIDPDFQISLFADKTINVLIKQVERNQDQVMITGQIEGSEYSEVILNIKESSLQAFISSGNEVYEITSSGENHEVKQINTGFYIREKDNEDAIQLETESTSFVNTTDSVDPVTLDVAMVYTNAVVQKWGGESNVIGLLELNISQMNLGFQNSGIIHQVNLVGTKLVDYNEASLSVYDEGVIHSDQEEWENVSSRILQEFTWFAPTGSFFEDAREFRNTTGADLLVVVAELPDIYCGLAGLATQSNIQAFDLWFSLINSDCIGAGSLTISHEIGHNLGCTHDRDNNSGFDIPYFDYSYGYQAKDNFYTIMAYGNWCGSCAHINHFSNPEISYNGLPTGVDIDLPLSANNALTINLTSPVVSQLRNIKAPHLTSPANYETVTATPTFVWEQVNEATSYILRITQTGNSVLEREISASTSCDGSTCAYTLGAGEALGPGSFSWKIISSNSLGQSPSTTRVLIVPGVPAKPVLYSPGGETKNPIPTYRWYALPEADEYLLRLTEPDGVEKLYGWFTKAELGCESWQIGCTWVSTESLVKEGDYSWSVKARNAYGEGEYSTIWYFSFLFPAPQPPQKISPIDHSSIGTNPTFTWLPVESATQYRLLIEQSSEDVLDKLLTPDEVCNNEICTYTLNLDESLVSGSQVWWVQAGNSTGFSDALGWWIIVEGVPSKPATFSPGNPYSPTVIDELLPMFRWIPLIEADKYHLEVKNFTGEVIFQTEILEETDCFDSCAYTLPSALGTNGIHEWTLAAENSYGIGPTSRPLYFDLYSTALAPANFGKVKPATESSFIPINPTLSWQRSNGATSYEYCYDVTNDGSCSSWIINGGLTSTTLSGLNKNTTYYWHVRSSNSIGTTYADGSETAFWSFTTEDTPSAFSKTAPPSGEVKVSISPTISWESSNNAKSYEYCIDTSKDNACSNWKGDISSTSVSLSALSPDTTYYWHVRSINSVDTIYSNGSAAEFWSFTTQGRPDNFVKLSPVDSSEQPLNLSLAWESNNAAEYYEYCIDSTNDNTCSTWRRVSSVSGIVPSGLLPSTSYYWQVRAVNAAGSTEADNGVWWSFTTQGAPDSFSKLAPYPGASQVSIFPTLSWEPSSNATLYEYCYDTSNDGACSNWIYPYSGTSALLPTLKAGTTYYWHVRASNPSGTTYSNGSSTEFWSFTVIDITPDYDEKLTSSKATFNWNDTPDATAYKLQCSTDPGFNILVFNQKVSTSEYTYDTFLKPDTIYFWRFRPIFGVVKGDWSDTYRFYSMDPLTAPLLASPPNSALLALPVTLSWFPVTNATQYQLQLARDAAFTDRVFSAKLPDTFQDIADLAPGKYYWRVKAIEEGGLKSPWSEVRMLTVTSIMPPDLYAPGNDATVGQDVNLSWQDMVDAVQYKLQVSKDALFTRLIVNEKTTDPTKDLLGLKARAYYWRVKAIDIDGFKSPWSTVWKFTVVP